MPAAINTICAPRNASSTRAAESTADCRLHTGAEAGFADLNHIVGLRRFQCLRIGIGHNKFNAGHAFVDHVLHRIAAGAANADHFDNSA
jgi:hypothetical protein